MQKLNDLLSLQEKVNPCLDNFGDSELKLNIVKFSGELELVTAYMERNIIFLIPSKKGKMRQK